MSFVKFAFYEKRKLMPQTSEQTEKLSKYANEMQAIHGVR